MHGQSVSVDPHIGGGVWPSQRDITGCQAMTPQEETFRVTQNKQGVLYVSSGVGRGHGRGRTLLEKGASGLPSLACCHGNLALDKMQNIDSRVSPYPTDEGSVPRAQS